MAIANVVCRGYGPSASIAFILTRGFGSAAASDSVPDVFSFTAQTDVALSTTITSNTITVTGIDQPATITANGGEYSINGGSYTSSAGSVINGDTVTARHTSSSSYSTVVNTVITIGGIAGTLTSTTLEAPLVTTPTPRSRTVIIRANGR